MMVLVDTSVWSLALRRKQTDLSPAEQDLKTALQELVQDGRAQIVGPVRQELLSGIRGDETFRKVRDALRAFDEPQLPDPGLERSGAHEQYMPRPGHRRVGDRLPDLRCCAPSPLGTLPQGSTGKALLRLRSTLSFSILYKPSNA